MKAFHSFKFEGNVTLAWDTIDRDLLRRFKTRGCYQPTTNRDFFLQAVDIIYWLNILSRSVFVQHYLTCMMRRELEYVLNHNYLSVTVAY